MLGRSRKSTLGAKNALWSACTPVTMPVAKPAESITDDVVSTPFERSVPAMRSMRGVKSATVSVVATPSSLIEPSG